MMYVDTIQKALGKNLMDRVFPPKVYRGKEITRILVDGKIPVWEVDGEYFNSRSEAYEYVRSQQKTK